MLLDRVKKVASRKTLKHFVWMEMAHTISKLGTCDRAEVGAVAIKDGRMVSQGYNGMPAGFDHCGEREGGHLMYEDHCLGVHAEENVLIKGDREDLEGSTIYCTHLPCPRCFMKLANAKVNDIYYHNEYRKDDIYDEIERLAEKHEIGLIDFSEIVENTQKEMSNGFIG